MQFSDTIESATNVRIISAVVHDATELDWLLTQLKQQYEVGNIMFLEESNDHAWVLYAIELFLKSGHGAPWIQHTVEDFGGYVVWLGPEPEFEVYIGRDCG